MHACSIFVYGLLRAMRPDVYARVRAYDIRVYTCARLRLRVCTHKRVSIRCASMWMGVGVRARKYTEGNTQNTHAYKHAPLPSRRTGVGPLAPSSGAHP